MRVYNLLREAWSVGSVDYSAAKIRSRFLIIALCGDSDLSRANRESAPRLFDIPLDTLRKEFRLILAGSPKATNPEFRRRQARRASNPCSLGERRLTLTNTPLTSRSEQNRERSTQCWDETLKSVK